VSKTLTPTAIVYDLEFVSDPQLSADGNHLVYTRAKAEQGKKWGGSHIWLSDRHGNNPRQLTQAGERNHSARFSPVDEAIAFVSNRVKRSGLFLMPYGGESIELTRHNGAIGEIAWSPDGTRIAYVANYDPENPDERDPGAEDAPRVRVTSRVDYKQDSRGYLGDLRPQVWIIDVASRERRMLTSDPVDHNFPAWSPDGKSIAVRISNHNGMHSQLGIIDVATSEVTLVGPESGTVGCWAWSPTGDRILIAGDPDQSWQLDLFVFHVADDRLERLTDDLPCLPDSGFPTVAPTSQPAWIDDDRAVFHAVRGGASGLYQVTVSTAAVEEIASWKAINGAPSFDAKRRFVAQAQTSVDEVSTILIYDLEQKSAEKIITLNADQPPLASWTTFQIERNGKTIDAWLLRPASAAGANGKLPLVLDIHGGPNSFYGYGFSPIQQAIAGAGFALLFCNPRGSSSYGREFTQAVSQDWAGEDYLDLMAVLDAAIANPEYNIDPDRLGVYGYSYGGFMTSWIIGHNHRFKAAVIGAPVVDLVSFYGTADIGHTFGPKQIGGTPWTNRDEYVKRSPLTDLPNARTPSLIIHGEADDRCPIGQGEQCFMTLLQHGCEVEFVRYPEGAHTFQRTGYPAHREDALKRITGWFSEHLVNRMA
jgi:dipeptidyl aminopeptidase/acylaminoacyl peptidase